MTSAGSLRIPKRDINEPDRHGQAVLHGAVRFASVEQIETLIEQGASINHIDKFGNTPLYYAANDNIKECLIRYGAV